MKIRTLLRGLELLTRPVHPESRAAMDKRWAELPGHVKTPAQLLGRTAVGCEGTHGVFPKCNLTCSPCYHSADANKVRIDGGHTVTAVRQQMEFLRKVRGPRAHAQLIGGEVSLLPSRDHAAALEAMRANGREPMSMTLGDFDYDYLLDVVLDDAGRPRFRKVSFAAHFDSLMRGRRGAVRPRNEAELNPFRARFAEMFLALTRDHGISSYNAHNMTVTPTNVNQVAEVTRAVLDMPYDMLSFQPAAYIGDDRRWSEDFDEITIDAVWSRIEAGAGHRIPWQGTQFGDTRCNRTAVALSTGSTLTALLDPDDPRDLAARDRLLKHYGGMYFGGTPAWIVGAKTLRALLAHLDDLPVIVSFARRLVHRAGGWGAVATAARHRRLSFKTFVVHNFMDASDVAPVWALMERGVDSDDPKIRETQERLARPSVLLLDEPFSALDPELRATMHQLLAQLRERLAPTILMVTNDRDEAAAVADRIALLSHGRLLQHDSVDRMYSRPASLEVHRLMGGTNEVPGTIRDGVHYSVLGDLDLPEDTDWPDGPGVLVIRRESIGILDETRDRTEHRVQATVRDIRVLGPRRLVTVDASGIQLHAEAPFGRLLGVGDDTRLSIPLSARAVVAGPARSGWSSNADLSPAVLAAGQA